MLSLRNEIQLLFFHTPVLSFEIGNVKQDWPPVSIVHIVLPTTCEMLIFYTTNILLHVCTIYIQF